MAETRRRLDGEAGVRIREGKAKHLGFNLKKQTSFFLVFSRDVAAGSPDAESEFIAALGEAGGEFAPHWVRQRARGSDWVRHRGERPTLGEARTRASHIG